MLHFQIYSGNAVFTFYLSHYWVSKRRSHSLCPIDRDHRKSVWRETWTVGQVVDDFRSAAKTYSSSDLQSSRNWKTCFMLSLGKKILYHRVQNDHDVSFKSPMNSPSSVKRLMMRISYGKMLCRWGNKHVILKLLLEFFTQNREWLMALCLTMDPEKSVKLTMERLLIFWNRFIKWGTITTPQSIIVS